MIEVIEQQFKPGMNMAARLNVTREFLQILCLKIMSEKKIFNDTAFVGGTALRILFGTRRFSEDLDFSLINVESFSIVKVEEQFVKGFQGYGLAVEMKRRSKGAVQSILLKFPSLLKELGLSPLPAQKLSIRWDIDTNPPHGATLVNTLVNRIYVFQVCHYDLASLFAGKLHACFYRSYAKGRDWYDFVWYISKKTKPNFKLLNNAIQQTEKKDLKLNHATFKQFLLDQMPKFNFQDLKRDVERFLEDPQESSIFDRDVILNTIQKNY
jgi:predicted nucleotidyltransferase component of viral defense system